MNNKYLNNEMNNSYIFIDLSNIYIGFYNYIMYNNKKYNICNPKMDYNMLFSILEKDKKVEKRILVGSKNNKIEKIKTLKKIDYELFLLERINNKENGVDDLLHEKITNTLLLESPGYIIIATGDGKKGDYTNNSFYNICIEALTLGWYVTIVSWKKQISKRYTLGEELYDLLKDVNMKDKFNILYLDNYVEKLIL